MASRRKDVSLPVVNSKVVLRQRQSARHYTGAVRITATTAEVGGISRLVSWLSRKNDAGPG